MIEFSDTVQHDDHCTLVFAGRLWWILAVHGPAFFVTCEEGQIILDLSAVDWDAYHARADEMLRQAFPDAFEEEGAHHG